MESIYIFVKIYRSLRSSSYGRRKLFRGYFYREGGFVATNFFDNSEIYLY